MEATLQFESEKMVRDFLGVNDANRKALESRFQIRLAVKELTLKISGKSLNVRAGEGFIRDLFEKNKTGLLFDDMIDHHQESKESGIPFTGMPFFQFTSKDTSPKTPAQKDYLDTVFKNEVTFCIGPAGTGKTYLAVALAIEFLKEQKVRRIILSRPAVESGEKLGFLPGDMNAKINPYLRPLMDSLMDLMDPQEVQDLIDQNIIEVIPLAYMRGRSLNDSFIILDEAQNTTPSQMKMFLTRLGKGSHMVITGDITQTDFQEGQSSGLVHAEKLLNKVGGIGFVRLTEADVQRSPLVRAILRAYEKDASKKMKPKGKATRKTRK